MSAAIMDAKQLASRYMHIIFENGDLDELYRIFHPALQFEGPLFKFASAKEYIEALKNSPPDHFGYEMLHAFEHDTTACFIYRFAKPGVTTTMAQTFEVHHNRITHIHLVFDSSAFQT